MYSDIPLNTDTNNRYRVGSFFRSGKFRARAEGGAGGGSPPSPTTLRKKKKSNRHFQVKSNFAGVRMFGWRTSQRYLNLLLALRSCSWWLISLKTPIFTKLHVVVDFCSNAEFIVARFPVKSEDLLTELNGYLKRILLADDVVHDALKTRLEI